MPSLSGCPPDRDAQGRRRPLATSFCCCSDVLDSPLWTSGSFRIFVRLYGIVLTIITTISTTVTFRLHFFSSVDVYIHFLFILLSVFLEILVHNHIESLFLTWILGNCLKFKMLQYVIFQRHPKTDSDLCIYHNFLRLNRYCLPNSHCILLPTHSCVFLTHSGDNQKNPVP